ncbi:MAG: flagellar hook capping FlgD N-terminal domain-containing protein [Candidatus Riflebacteria bacterium]|jgi:flagellar basal-body rod modification protein FlgD|nr:flagellar hook capping FlgD N-terminal domain-containing protein [Candidatus Riflebacteria bacterium]
MAIEPVDVSSSMNLTTSRTPGSALGKDDFLQLLTVQLKNQDPMNPMEDMDFIGQMSSFSSLEQMLNMNKQLETLTSTFSKNSQTQAMMYLGTTVTVKSEDMEEAITGVVDMVGFNDGVPFLKVGDEAYNLEDVQLVSPTIYETTRS